MVVYHFGDLPDMGDRLIAAVPFAGHDAQDEISAGRVDDGRVIFRIADLSGLIGADGLIGQG